MQQNSSAGCNSSGFVHLASLSSAVSAIQFNFPLERIKFQYRWPNGGQLRQPALPTTSPACQHGRHFRSLCFHWSPSPFLHASGIQGHPVESDFEPNSLETNDRTTLRGDTHTRRYTSKNVRRFSRLESHVLRRQLAFISRWHYNDSIDEVRPIQGNFFMPSAPRWAFVFIGSHFVRGVFMRNLKHG